MRYCTLAWSKCISWMLREIGPPEIQNALHLLYEVVSLICTLTTKYHFILSNLQRHNRQLGYWWRAWSRWMIWTSYSDQGELGPLPTSPHRTCPGWTTRTRIGKPKEWSTKIKGMRAENGTYSTLIGEKNVCLRMLNHLLRKEREHNLRRRVFSCWNAKTKPPLAGRNLVRILIGISPVK